MIISMISAKGGVGKTTITANLGVTLAKDFGKKVLLIDGNVTTPTLGLQLGIISQSKTLIDVLEGDIPIYEAIYTHPSGVHILPASLSVKHLYGKIERLKDRVHEIKDSYDIILIDCGAGIGKEVISAIQASDAILIITNPDMASITAAVRAIKISKLSEASILGIVLNKVRNKKYELNKAEIEDLCESKIIVKVPFDNYIPESAKEMEPAILYKVSSSSLPIKKLASFLTGIPYEEPFTDKIKRIIRSRI